MFESFVDSPVFTEGLNRFMVGTKTCSPSRIRHSCSRLFWGRFLSFNISRWRWNARLDPLGCVGPPPWWESRSALTSISSQITEGWRSFASARRGARGTLPTTLTRIVGPSPGFGGGHVRAAVRDECSHTHRGSPSQRKFHSRVFLRTLEEENSGKPKLL